MRRVALGLLVLLACAPAAHAANVPVLTAEVPAGKGARIPLKPAAAPVRVVDGRFTDWPGALPGFGGALLHKRGMLVYQDHLFDAWGADNGQDQQRMAIEEPLQAAVPETYRVDPALEYAPEEFGIPLGPFTFSTHYGDLEHQDQADLSEVRLGTDDSGDLWLLARTTTMDDMEPRTAVLVLLDTAPGATRRAIGFGSGLTSAGADSALLLTGDRGFVQDLATGSITPLPPGSVATNATGYGNAVEARLPASLLAGSSAPKIAVAAGKPNADGSALENVANVAFRTAEPARDFWDKRQALALEQGTVDPFFTRVDLDALQAGANERYRPLSGYHDRIFESSPAISREGGRDGILQHYGLYLPTSYSPDRRNPAQWWFHFRGGRAHIAAAVVPGVIKQMGEDADSVVVTPNGRGSSTWYVGKGQADYQEVWADVHKLVRLDRNREYIAGHSMGGWASWLLPILQPDRWAAAFPASGPPTQGLWAGCEEDACFQSANGGRPRDQWTTPLLENLTHVPYVNYHGAADELVPLSGVTMQMLKMRELGLRYRYYVYPHEEHYGPPIMDQWADGVEYEHRFTRNPNPASFTFIRSMPMETAVEQVNSGDVPLSFDFDRAYWMSRLEPDEANGVARIEARSLAIPEPAHDVLPDVVPPASANQPNPAIAEGQRWIERAGSEKAARNAFAIELTGAKAVRLDMKRMRIKTKREVDGAVTTEKPLRLELVGRWPKDVTATIDGSPVTVARDGRVLAIDVPAGTHELRVN